MCGRAHLVPALSGGNAPSYSGGATPLRLPAFTLRGDLHSVQDGSTFFPRAFGLVRSGVLFSNGIAMQSDTPLGLTPSGCSRPAGDGFQGGADTSHTGSAVRDGGIPAEPFWRPGGRSVYPVYRRAPRDDTADRTRGPYQKRRRTGWSRASPPDDWGCSPDACGGLFLSRKRMSATAARHCSPAVY